MEQCRKALCTVMLHKTSLLHFTSCLGTTSSSHMSCLDTTQQISSQRHLCVLHMNVLSLFFSSPPVEAECCLTPNARPRLWYEVPTHDWLGLLGDSPGSSLSLLLLYFDNPSSPSIISGTLTSTYPSYFHIFLYICFACAHCHSIILSS